MRAPIGLAMLALAAAIVPPAPSANAQGAPPPGSYQRSCRDIRMEGQFLHAWCRGSQGSGVSSINVLSCRTDIIVGPDGGLACAGPGLGIPPPPGRPSNRPPPNDDDDYGRPPGGGGGGDRWSATLFERRGFRGASIQLYGDTPNLARTGLNDRVRSISLPRRAPPWLVCSDANYRGRCVTIRGDVDNTARLGMLDSISSLRPLR